MLLFYVALQKLRRVLWFILGTDRHIGNIFDSVQSLYAHFNSKNIPHYRTAHFMYHWGVFLLRCQLFL
jgi:hypothetical protein